MTNHEGQADQNEHAYREAMAVADKLLIPEERDLVRDSINEFYNLLRKRIERGVYSQKHENVA